MHISEHRNTSVGRKENGGDVVKISARNVMKGTIKAIDKGAVNVEVDVEISPGMEITSIITRKSCENLGLEVGQKAFVIIKASNVMIVVE